MSYKIRNAGILLGCGLMGGISLTVIKYLKSDRTSNCLSHEVTIRDDETGVSTLALKNLGLFQRFRLAARFLYLCILLTPAALLYGISYLLENSTLAGLSWRYLLFALQNAGPAFVKLGQWASTRRDLFPENFCTTLSYLHVHCLPHSWEETVSIMDASLGEGWQDKVVISDQTPIGSGCVAQVYQGRLLYCSDETNSLVAHAGGNGSDGNTEKSSVPVAVKVLHPRIIERMRSDIYLMKYVASWVDTLYPDVHWVALTDCVDEFSLTMEKQVRRCY